MTTHNFKTFLAIVCTTLVLSACASKDHTLAIEESTETGYFEQAQKASKAKNYTAAVEYLEQLESRYPFGRYSEQAQLELIFAHYKAGDFEASRAASSRFIRLHPQHNKLDYVYYMKGLAAYSLDRNILDRYLQIDMSKRDPGAARDSLVDFGILLNRYPDSQYADEARARMLQLRNQLAAHEIHAARYYLKRKAYIAAANRGRYVVENFPQTPSVPDGLAVMVQAYQQLGLTDLANQSLEILRVNAPDYPGLGEQGSFKIANSKVESKRSWLNRMSFGWLGSSGE